MLGLADKRPIIYPLLYVLSLSGNTLFVSDDGAYRRLLPNYGRMGHIGNVHVFTNTEINGEVLKQEGINTRDYDHVVYALLDNIEGKNGLIVYAKQDGSPFKNTHPLDGKPQTNDYKIVHIGFKAPTEKGAFYIPITESLLKECHVVENLCRLSPPKNTKVIDIMASLLAPGFSKTEKEMRKLLTYKGGLLT
jgi:hypothetical protein